MNLGSVELRVARGRVDLPARSVGVLAFPTLAQHAIGDGLITTFAEVMNAVSGPTTSALGSKICEQSVGLIDHKVTD